MQQQIGGYPVEDLTQDVRVLHAELRHLTGAVTALGDIVKGLERRVVVLEAARKERDSD